MAQEQVEAPVTAKLAWQETFQCDRSCIRNDESLLAESVSGQEPPLFLEEVSLLQAHVSLARFE